MPMEWVCTTAIPAYQSTTKPGKPVSFSVDQTTAIGRSVPVPGPNPYRLPHGQAFRYPFGPPTRIGRGMQRPRRR